MNVVTFRNVTKRYGSLEALRNVSFEIAQGEIVALLGPNGAGKTTAIDILLGLRTPTEGSVSIDGNAPDSLAARRRIGATPQDTGFPDGLKVRELVEFAAAHYPHPRPAAEILEAFDLVKLANHRVGGLSGGQQRRIALALAFAGNNELVVLDEPSTGLDVESRRRLWEQLKASVRDERTVLFTTHYLEEAEALATRIIVIDRGEVRFDGSPLDFRSRFGVKRVEYLGEPVMSALHDLRIERDGDRTIVTTSDTDSYIRELVRAEAPFSELRVAQSSFEEIFLDLTGASK
jgi:ABC-2 type transport system ATP-binding protein